MRSRRIITCQPRISISISLNVSMVGVVSHTPTSLPCHRRFIVIVLTSDVRTHTPST